METADNFRSQSTTHRSASQSQTVPSRPTAMVLIVIKPQDHVKSGRRAGVRVNLSSNGGRFRQPAIVLTNTDSVCNKLDVLYGHQTT